MDRDAAKLELERIATENDGVLFPAHVVEAARATESPLHDWFEWDDSEAAERYRLWQARKLIAVHVVVSEAPKVDPVRAFVSLSTDRKGEGGYRVMADVQSDEAMRKVLLQDAIRDLELMQRKYRAIRELDRVFAEAEKVSRQYKAEAERPAA